MTRVWLFLAEGFEEAEAVIPWDLFRRAGYETTAWGLTGLEVTGSHGIQILADKAWSDAYKDFPDAVFLPGGMPGAKNLSEHAGLTKFLRDFHGTGGLVSAVCAAPAVVLGAHGFLKGKRFTCFPGMESQVTDAFWTDGDVVEDGNIVTSRGMGTASALALHLITRLSGKEKSEELARRALWH